MMRMLDEIRVWGGKKYITAIYLFLLNKIKQSETLCLLQEI